MPRLRTYQIYVKVDGRWVWQYDVEAESHVDGLRSVAAISDPAHESKPIRVEQVAPAPRRPARGASARSARGR
jgi:hypothetical protein